MVKSIEYSSSSIKPDKSIQPLALPLLFLIRIYQICLSPVIGQNCRFDPTCSNYTMEAIKKYGPIKGSWMGLKRIGRCHPWHDGGYDPVE